MSAQDLDINDAMRRTLSSTRSGSKNLSLALKPFRNSEKPTTAEREGLKQTAQCASCEVARIAAPSVDRIPTMVRNPPSLQ